MKKSLDLISARLTQICMNTSTWSVYISTAHAGLPALIESACPSCLDLIILLSGCSLTHIIILQGGTYGITVPSITAYSTVHILWMTGCHYILMHLIENIQSVWASYVDSSHCSQQRMLAIYMPINVHMLQIYATTDRRTRRRNRAGAPQTDLWVIMGYEYVCAHNEIYKLLQMPCLGFCSSCLMPQHVLLAFTKFTKCLLGHFHPPTG